jgi:hypothetical protein
MRDISEQTVFEQGYKQAIELYNGISPETVKEMTEAIKILDRIADYWVDSFYLKSRMSRLIKKIEREMES